MPWLGDWQAAACCCSEALTAALLLLDCHPSIHSTDLATLQAQPWCQAQCERGFRALKHYGVCTHVYLGACDLCLRMQYGMCNSVSTSNLLRQGKTK